MKTVKDLGESLIDEQAVPAVVECVCKCGYRWVSRLPSGWRPKACPECKSRSWDKRLLAGTVGGKKGFVLYIVAYFWPTAARCCSTCRGIAVAGQRWCKSCHAAYMRVWRRTNWLSPAQRLRAVARATVRVYLTRGKIIKAETCELANDTCKGKLEAHHEDYAKPLVVRWLCRSHHVRLECEKAGKVSRVYV